MVAAPLYADGRKDAGIVGVIYFVPPETFLNNIVSSTCIGALILLDSLSATTTEAKTDKSITPILINIPKYVSAKYLLILDTSSVAKFTLV